MNSHGFLVKDLHVAVWNSR